jgi:hypothetical protein
MVGTFIGEELWQDHGMWRLTRFASIDMPALPGTYSGAPNDEPTAEEGYLSESIY